MRRRSRFGIGAGGALALAGLLAGCADAAGASLTPVASSDVDWPGTRFAATVPAGAFLDDAYRNGFGDPVEFEGSLCGITADGEVVVTVLADDDPKTPTVGVGYDVATGGTLWQREALECDGSTAGQRLSGDVLFGADRATDVIEVVDARTGESSSAALQQPPTPHPMTVNRVVRLSNGSALVEWWQPDDDIGAPARWYDVVDPSTGVVMWRPPADEACAAGGPARAFVVCTPSDGRGVTAYEAATGREVLTADAAGSVTVLADGFIAGGVLYDAIGTPLGEGVEPFALVPDGAVLSVSDLPEAQSLRAVDGSGEAAAVGVRHGSAVATAFRSSDGFARLTGGTLQGVTRDGAGLLFVSATEGSREIVLDVVVRGEQVHTKRVPLHRSIFGHAEAGGLIAVSTATPDGEDQRGLTVIVPPKR